MFKRSKEQEKKGSEKRDVLVVFVLVFGSFRFCDYSFVTCAIADAGRIKHLGGHSLTD